MQHEDDNSSTVVHGGLSAALAASRGDSPAGGRQSLSAMPRAVGCGKSAVADCLRRVAAGRGSPRRDNCGIG